MEVEIQLQVTVTYKVLIEDPTKTHLLRAMLIDNAVLISNEGGGDGFDYEQIKLHKTLTMGNAPVNPNIDYNPFKHA